MKLEELGSMHIQMMGMASGKKIDVMELTYIDESNLSEEFAKQSSLFAYFAVLYAQARYNRDRAEKAMKDEEALAFVDFKNDADNVPSGGRTVSDALASMLVAQDKTYLRAKAMYIEAELEFRTLEGIVRALDMRANMLVSLGAQVRSESDMTGMRVYDENPAESIRKTLRKKPKS